jgi:hypothetical protein
VRSFQPPGPAGVPEGMDGARDFDFWVGTWHCVWDGGEGGNVVDWACGGRVLRERFDAEPHGLVGTSLSVYDAAAGCWVQTWMDSNGSWFHLKGARGADGMELRTTTAEDGYRKRMRFTDIHDDRFDWEWSRSQDGAAWEPVWAISYTRDRLTASSTTALR